MNGQFRYDIGSDAVVLEATAVRILRQEFLAWTGAIASITSLHGSQVFIHANAFNEALGSEMEKSRAELKHAIVLGDVELRFGVGGPLKIKVADTKSIANEWHDDVRMYVFPN